MLGAMATTVEAVRGKQLGARERILETAYVLFAHRGVRGVGIDEVIDRSRVAKATLYRHFPSKDDLVVAFLREQRWTLEWVEAEPDDAAPSPRSSCSRSFDLFDETRILPGRRVVYLENIRSVVSRLAEEAGPCAIPRRSPAPGTSS